MPSPSVQKKLPAASEPDSIGLEAIFGPPPLLEGEDPAAFQNILAQVTSTVEPKDILEQIWVRDFVDVTWEIMRLRRLLPPIIVSGYGKAVEEIFKAEYGYANAATLSQKWLRDEEGVRDAFDQLLSELELTMDDVHARAIAHKIDVIERVHQMIENAEHRRRLVYAEIDRRRETLIRRLKEVAKTLDKTIEGEARETGAGAIREAGRAA